MDEVLQLDTSVSFNDESLTPLTPPLPSITFAYPYGNGFTPEWLESLIWLLLYEIPKPKESRILGSILKAGSCYVDMNRNKLAIDFNNKTKDDWILMIDPDVQFSHDILEKLAAHIIAYPEARIIAGRVNLLNGLPVFYLTKPDGTNIHQPFPFEGLKPFDLVGTGIMCVHREVFVTLHKGMKHPHYFSKIIDDHMNEIGDDFSFCIKAKHFGYKLYGAWDVEGIHWKPQPCSQRYLTQDQLEIKVK